jgi:hypothetical protein
VDALGIVGRLLAYIAGEFIDMFIGYRMVQSGYWIAALVILVVGGIATGLGFAAGGMWGFVWLGLTIATLVFVISGGIVAHVNSGKRVR